MSLPTRPAALHAGNVIRAALAAPQRSTSSARPSAALSPAQAAAIAGVARALADWGESPEAQALRAAAVKGEIRELRAALDALFASEPVAVHLQSLSVERDGIAGFQSVAVGIAGQIDLGVGLYGSIGYAADIGDPSKVISSSVCYVYGAFTEGLEEGLDGGFQLALWRISVADMPGYYWGCELDVTDVGGFEVAGLAKDKEGEEVQAVLVDISGGENDGVDGMEFYAYTWGITRAPIAQNPGNYFLILTNLVCKSARQATGHDEVVVQVTPDGGNTYLCPYWNYYAMSSNSQNSWDLGRSVWFDKQVVVTLVDGSDELATFTFDTGNLPNVGSTTSPTNGNTVDLRGTKYQLTALRVV